MPASLIRRTRVQFALAVKFLCVLGLACGVVPASSVFAEGLTLGSPFSDHMVLQAEKPVVVWGWDEPGQSVKVTIAGETAEAKAGSDGRWQVELPALSEVGPYELKASGSSEASIRDVVAGEVWYCSGQSNMRWQLQHSWGWDWVRKMRPNPNIRLLALPSVSSETPSDRIEAQWEISGPDTLAEFSGVAYFFGRDLSSELDRPVGLIMSAWGGSKIRAWVPGEKLEQSPHYKAEAKSWDASVKRHQKAIKAWEASGREGKRPGWSGAGPQHALSGLYNGMTHPIEPYGVRGVLWYQGESDAWMSDRYADLFVDLMESWREGFGDPELPVFMVQLPGFEKTQAYWPTFREIQRQLALEQKHLDIAVTIDVGKPDDIHPPNKKVVGERLSRLALAETYGREIVAGSPRPISAKSDSKDPSAVIVEFDRVGEGLRISGDADSPGAFVLMQGDDQEQGEAELVDARRVRVRGGKLTRPDTVRYAWSNFPHVNLVNSEKLPVTPFSLKVERSTP